MGFNVFFDSHTIKVRENEGNKKKKKQSIQSYHSLVGGYVPCEKTDLIFRTPNLRHQGNYDNISFVQERKVIIDICTRNNVTFCLCQALLTLT